MITRAAPQTYAKEYTNIMTFPGVQLAAIVASYRELHAQGFNVFPVRPNSKKAFYWDVLRTTRLPDYATIEGYTTGRASLFVDQSGNVVNLACMAGHTSGNLTVIDCETGKAALKVRTELEARSIPYWEVQTSRGAHFWVKLSCEAVNLKKCTIPDVEIRASGCYVLVPPSVHPDGPTYRWVKKSDELPPVQIEKLAWLGVSRDTITKFDNTDQNHLDALYTLNNGALEGERNDKLFHLACYLLGCRYSESETTRLVTSAAQKCTPAYPGKGDNPVSDIVGSAAKRVISKPTKSTPKPTLQAQQFAENYTWDKRTGLTDKAVFEACIVRYAQSQGKAEFRASVREIAELANINKETASKSLRRLCDSGILEWLTPDDSECAAYVYRFGSQVYVEPYTSYATNARYSVRISIQQKDTFNRFKSGERIYFALLDTPQTSYAAIANATGLSRSTVQSAIKKLKALGLVDVDATGHYYAVQDVDFIEIADTRHTLGRTEKKQQKHALERSQNAFIQVYKAIHKTRLTIHSSGSTITPTKIDPPAPVDDLPSVAVTESLPMSVKQQPVSVPPRGTPQPPPSGWALAFMTTLKDWRQVAKNDKNFYHE